MKITTYKEAHDCFDSYWESTKGFSAKDPIAQQALLDQGAKIQQAIQDFACPYFAVAELTSIAKCQMSMNARNDHEAKFATRVRTADLLRELDGRIFSLLTSQKKMNCCQKLSYYFHSSKKED